MWLPFFLFFLSFIYCYFFVFLCSYFLCSYLLVLIFFTFIFLYIPFFIYIFNLFLYISHLLIFYFLHISNLLFLRNEKDQNNTFCFGLFLNNFFFRKMGTQNKYSIYFFQNSFLLYILVLNIPFY